jgi:hypothetical protein
VCVRGGRIRVWHQRVSNSPGRCTNRRPKWANRDRPDQGTGGGSSVMAGLVLMLCFLGLMHLMRLLVVLVPIHALLPPYASRFADLSDPKE